MDMTLVLLRRHYFTTKFTMKKPTMCKMLDQANLLRVYNDWISCDLFHDMLAYKLIQYDRTCQWVINIIKMEKAIAPNNFAQKKNFMDMFFFKRTLLKSFIRSSPNLNF